MEEKEEKTTTTVDNEKVVDNKDTEKPKEIDENVARNDNVTPPKDNGEQVQETSQEANGIKIEDVVLKSDLEKKFAEFKKQMEADKSKYEAQRQSDAEKDKRISELEAELKKYKGGDFGTQNTMSSFESGKGEGYNKRPSYNEMWGGKNSFDK